jgi:hypothetical protein
MHPRLENLRPYTALQLAGRDVYQREGCVNCHTQTVRPLRWVIVNDGLWRLRTRGDTLFALGTVRCRMRVVGCVMSPEDPGDLPAFVEERRQTLIRELAKMRAEVTN